MFKTRLLSGIVLIILALFFLITGGNVLLVVTALLSLIGMMEFLRMVKIHKTPLAFLGYAAVLALYVLLFIGNTEKILAIIVIYLIASMAVYVFFFS